MTPYFLWNSGEPSTSAIAWGAAVARPTVERVDSERSPASDCDTIVV
jgi:hypothetical protein